MQCKRSIRRIRCKNNVVYEGDRYCYPCSIYQLCAAYLKDCRDVKADEKKSEKDREERARVRTTTRYAPYVNHSRKDICRICKKDSRNLIFLASGKPICTTCKIKKYGKWKKLI